MSTTAKWVLTIAVPLVWVMVVRTVMTGAPDRSMGLLDLIPVALIWWVWKQKPDVSGSHDPNGPDSTDQDGRNSASDTTDRSREESKGSIEVRVKEIIAHELAVDPEKVTPEASLKEDLGADSLDVVELVMAFEEEFIIDIPDEDAKEMATVGEAISYLRQRDLTWEVLQADDLVQKMSDSAPYSPDQSQSSVLLCSECGHGNPAEVNFCTRCRAKMTLQCNKCGFKSPQGSEFCGSCGEETEFR